MNVKSYLNQARMLCAAATPGPFKVEYERDGNGAHET
jgi:hypothetical protein